VERRDASWSSGLKNQAKRPYVELARDLASADERPPDVLELSRRGHPGPERWVAEVIEDALLDLEWERREARGRAGGPPGRRRQAGRQGAKASTRSVSPRTWPSGEDEGNGKRTCCSLTFVRRVLARWSRGRGWGEWEVKRVGRGRHRGPSGVGVTHAPYGVGVGGRLEGLPADQRLRGSRRRPSFTSPFATWCPTRSSSQAPRASSAGPSCVSLRPRTTSKVRPPERARASGCRADRRRPLSPAARDSPAPLPLFLPPQSTVSPTRARRRA
jgi:hypothetical protein